MYRTGNHQPQNVYRDDRYIGVMFDPQTAAEVVAAMNRQAGEPQGSWCNGGPTLAGAICGRPDPHGPHDRCGRLDCDHWHCDGQPS